jgi:hypothetical protein
MKKLKQGYFWAFRSKALSKKSYVLVLLGLSACIASRSLAPTPEALPSMQAKVPGITYQRANEGFQLYKAKCGSCHRLHSPSEYTMRKWENILPKMFLLSKMFNESDRSVVRDYVYALSK